MEDHPGRWTGLAGQGNCACRALVHARIPALERSGNRAARAEVVARLPGGQRDDTAQRVAAVKR